MLPGGGSGDPHAAATVGLALHGGAARKRRWSVVVCRVGPTPCSGDVGLIWFDEGMKDE